jgi:hypothetical protein
MLKPELIGPEGLCIQVEYEEPYEHFLIETNVLTNDKYDQLLSLVTKNNKKPSKTKRIKKTK